MSRFHSSMSWNEPSNNPSSDSSQCESESSSEDDFASSWLGDIASDYSGDDVDQPWQPDDATSSEWSQLSPHRNYFLPLHYEPNYNYPLVVWLHSDGFNENQVDHVMPHISVRNYVAAGIRGVRAADSAGHRFDWPTSPAAIQAAHHAVIETIDEAVEQFSIHSQRIVLAGYGSGGSMALRIAMRQPERFAGVVALGARLPRGRSVFGQLSHLRANPLRMLWSWGTDNPRFRHDALNEDLRQAMMIKARVEVRQYPADDEMDTVVLRDVNEWIMRHVVSNQSSVAAERWASSPTAYSAN